MLPVYCTGMGWGARINSDPVSLSSISQDPATAKEEESSQATPAPLPPRPRFLLCPLRTRPTTGTAYVFACSFAPPPAVSPLDLHCLITYVYISASLICLACAVSSHRNAQHASRKSNPCTGTTTTTLPLDTWTASHGAKQFHPSPKPSNLTPAPPPDATTGPVPVTTLRFIARCCFARPRSLPRNAPPMPTPRSHAPLLAALLLLLLLLAAGAADAQTVESWDRGNGGIAAPGARQPPSFSAPMVVLLVALIATFFFIGFFSIYIRRCGRGDISPARSIPAAALLALSRQDQQQQGPQSRQRGLDPDVLASFPTMTYAEARALREDGGGKAGEAAVLECAVCLSEFEDEERLRLLPECSHAFHPDCIGEWLAGHVTCPVCRRSLVPEAEEKPAEANGSSSEEEERPVQVVVIDVNQESDGEEERRMEAAELERIGSLRRAVRSRSGRPFSRAHSTGHSLSARLDGDLERFTLRLPEQVRREMVSESLRRTVAREGGARSARIGRSDRWPSFIARTFSSRVPFWAASRRAPDAAETAGAPTPATVREKTVDLSSSSSKGSVRFDCLGGGVVGARVGDDSEDEPEEEKAIVVRRV